MYPILHKRPLNASVTLMEVEAPYIARKARAGQFIILRVNETGERIPLPIADHVADKGRSTIMYQKVGKTSLLLDTLSGRLGGRPNWKAAGRWPSSAAASGAPSPIPKPRRLMRPERRWT